MQEDAHRRIASRDAVSNIWAVDPVHASSEHKAAWSGGVRKFPPNSEGCLGRLFSEVSVWSSLAILPR